MKHRFILCAIIVMALALTAFSQATPSPTPSLPKVVYDSTGKVLIVKSVTPDNTIRVEDVKTSKRKKVGPKPVATNLATTPTLAPTALIAAPTAKPAAPQAVMSWWEKNGLLLIAMLLLTALSLTWMWWQNQTSQRHHERILEQITADRDQQRTEQQIQPPSSQANHFTFYVNGERQPAITSEANAADTEMTQPGAPAAAPTVAENDDVVATQTGTNES